MTPSARRLLVDECVPRQLLRHLGAHAARTVQDMGWAGVKNGRLLELAAAESEVLFTVDRDFADFADRVSGSVAVVILQSSSTDFAALQPHMTAVNEAIATVRTGEVRRVGG